LGEELRKQKPGHFAKILEGDYRMSDSITAAKHYFDTLNRDDWEEHIDQFYADQDWWDQYWPVFRDLRKAFPDYKFTILHIAADGPDVCLIGRIDGTHSAEFPYGELKGVSPTGKKISWDEAWWINFENGKPTGGYSVLDGVSRMHQLGLITLPDYVGY
jgi:predicted ester cyclase